MLQRLLRQLQQRQDGVLKNTGNEAKCRDEGGFLSLGATQVIQW